MNDATGAYESSMKSCYTEKHARTMSMTDPMSEVRSANLVSTATSCENYLPNVTPRHPLQLKAALER